MYTGSSCKVEQAADFCPARQGRENAWARGGQRTASVGQPLRFGDGEAQQEAVAQTRAERIAGSDGVGMVHAMGAARVDAAVALESQAALRAHRQHQATAWPARPQSLKRRRYFVAHLLGVMLGHQRTIQQAGRLAPIHHEDVRGVQQRLRKRLPRRRVEHSDDARLMAGAKHVCNGFGWRFELARGDAGLCQSRCVQRFGVEPGVGARMHRNNGIAGAVDQACALAGVSRIALDVAGVQALFRQFGQQRVARRILADGQQQIDSGAQAVASQCNRQPLARVFFIVSVSQLAVVAAGHLAHGPAMGMHEAAHNQDMAGRGGRSEGWRVHGGVVSKTNIGHVQ